MIEFFAGFAKIKIMIIPRFTLGRALIAVAILGMFFWLTTIAVQGEAWALAICMAVISLIAIFLLHTFSYLFSTFLATFVVPGYRISEEAKSPFAEDRLPPQLIDPQKIDAE